MQDKAAAHLHRSAIAHDEIAGAVRQHDGLMFIKNAELHQNVGEFHLLRAIDDQPHGALFRVRTDIDDRTREPAVVHSRHRQQELTIQKSGLFVRRSENIHRTKVSRIAQMTTALNEEL